MARPATIALLAAVAWCASAGSPAYPPDAGAESDALSIVRSGAAASVELRSAGLMVTLHVDPWHLEVRDRSTARPIVAEYPVEAHGRGGRSVGSLGFLVRSQSAAGGAAGRWFRVTAVQSIATERNQIKVVAATDDPSGRQLEIELGFPSPATMMVQVVPRPADGVIEIAEGFWSEPAEGYFGLGARFGALDARGSEAHARVQGRLDTLDGTGNHLPVPFFVSSRAWGVAVHGSQESVFQLNTARRDAAIVKVMGQALRFTLFAGRTPLDVVAAHARTTGLPPLPPMWAFGVWKTVLGGEQRVLAEVERLRSNELPATALWTYDLVDEARHLGWKRWVYCAVPPGPYRDPRGLIARLRGLGYRTLGYLSPEFRADEPLYGVAAARGYFVRDARGNPHLKDGMEGSPAALLDFTNPEAVGWWQGLVTSLLTDLGLDGWMQDGGDWAPEDGYYHSGVRGTAARNEYPAAYARATHEAAVRVRADYVSFMRAGFAGSQRYTSLTWPCDNVFSWSERTGMPSALRATLSGSVSGFPFWAPDIGGYFGCGDGGAGDEELWIRWLQIGALHPVMRDHLGDKCRTAIDVWSTPATVAAFHRYATLHQQLVPYLYGLALEAVESGLPLMRPVALMSPGDRRAARDEFTYLLGDDLLVAPVVEPGARHRALFLPEGEWVDWWEGRRYRGPAVVTVAAPLDRIPLFARAGALIPLADGDGRFIRDSARSWHPLTLRMYAPSEPTSESRLSLFDGSRVSVRLTRGRRVNVERAGGPNRRPLRLVVTGAPAPVEVRVGSAGALHHGERFGGWWHDRQTGETTIVVPGVVE